MDEKDEHILRRMRKHLERSLRGYFYNLSIDPEKAEKYRKQAEYQDSVIYRFLRKRLEKKDDQENGK